MLLRRLFVPIALTLCRQTTVKSHNMDLPKQFQSFAWCKPDWCFPSMSKETNELLNQCADIQPADVSDDVDEVIARSKAFPIPFPIETVRLEKLKVRRPIEKLKKNIVSTYPLIHERVLLLMTHFLIYKREFGSPIEKEFYKDMGVADLIDRILKKRAISFVGARDAYMLMSGEEGAGGWETIGTMQQKPPLVLEDLLSYDELKLAAYVYVSGHTECINDGERRNAGVVSEEKAEKSAIIIGAIGPRFQRPSRMDYEDILITEEQNCPDNGYGEEVTPTTCLNVLKTTYVRNNQSAKHMWRQMWSEFFQVPSYTYQELSTYVNSTDKSDQKQYTDRFIKLNIRNQEFIFDNEVYYKRIGILAETTLLEADARAKEEGKPAYVNIIGCGLGVWKISPHQVDVYVLTFLERARHMLRKELLQNVSDINFSYIMPTETILAMFNGTGSSKSKEKKLFFECKKHPRGGINVQILKRQPSSQLTGEDSGKLLVMTYPWDGNAHPGNEFWYGSLTSSGDPAAACSTQVSELHNAHINPVLRADRTRVAFTKGLATIQEYCQQQHT
ncbi:ADP-ribosylarginine hydrolase CG3568-like isoform X2 [Anticarsia gemmatalis]|uniref:ADP-ribosylarginine hydrolase CG3568-like isoform X2 n=1 Tax=Anticarsia gemmatalis TaxID=129554 RepID=UPI003F775CC6